MIKLRVLHNYLARVPLYLPDKVDAFVLFHIADVTRIDVEEHSWHTYNFEFHTFF